MFALDKKTGRVVWSHDLWSELGGSRNGRGYACSPLAYGSNVIVTVGGKEKLLVAFNQQDGKIAWRNLELAPSPSSPLIANIAGQDQLVLFAANEILGADPTNGNLLWSVPHKTDYGLNISLPVIGNDNRIFIFVGLRNRKPRDRADTKRKSNDRQRSLEEPEGPFSLRHSDQGRRLCLRFKRRFWPGILHRHQRENGPGSLAGSCTSKSFVRFCRWEVYHR